MDRRKKLVNTHEAVAKRILIVSAGRNSATVYPKVRIADVLNIERSGISNDQYSYALKAHFDFVVTDENEMPLFAVEYDGPTHFDDETIRRDLMKNELCERLGLPLARVRDEHIFKQARGIDYLTWLSEFHFAFEELVKAQQSGSFPEDEWPDPMLIVSHPHVDGHFPLFISGPARVSLRKMCTSKSINEAIPMVLRGDDRAGRTNVLLLLQLNDGSIVCTQSAMYLRQFGLSPAEAAEEVAIVNLEAVVREHLNAKRPGMSPQDARRRVIEFLRGHETPSFGVVSAHPYGFEVTCVRGPDGERWKVGALGDEPAVQFEVRRA